MTAKTETPKCWLCKTRPAASKAGTRGYSTNLCDECHAKLNGQVGVDPFETSRPLSAIEYEQRGRIAELEKELTACRAELAEVRKVSLEDCNTSAARAERAESALYAVTRERDDIRSENKRMMSGYLEAVHDMQVNHSARLAASEAARDQAIKALAEEGRLRGEAEAERNKTMALLSEARAIIAAQGQRIATAERDCQRLREALLMYHEAWNGNEGDWKGAMCRASKAADAALAAGGEG